MYTKPQKDECGEYFRRYVNQAPDTNILEALANQKLEVINLLNTLNNEQSLYRYADQKWSVKEVIGHMLDTERVFAYRALCIARNEKAPLPSMDENDYAKYANFDERSLQNLHDEYKSQREATIAMFKGFNTDILKRKGIASEVEFTVNVFPFIIAGHERHHLNVLQERYSLNF